MSVELREITAETVREICKLEVSADQRGYVASFGESIADAHVQPKSWFRAY